jgi:uncharacterized protein YbaP (TraB family)
MSKISVYDVVPTPKLADKLIGTSVSIVDENVNNITYNFTLQELLDLFIPNIPANTLQGILDYGNTATQDINLTGTINTTNLNVLDTANILNSNLTGDTYLLGKLFDKLNSSGTYGQVLKSTVNGVEWYTVPDAVIPTLQQVLTSGNTADKNIILSSNISAITATANTVISNTSLNINGTLKDNVASVGVVNQVLSSTGSGVQWVNLPAYSAVSPLLYDGPTKSFSIQVANSTQNGYLSYIDWINFDAKQNPITLTTVGNSGSSTLSGVVLNIPTYTLSGLGGVASVTANSPIQSSGGENPVISIPMANTSQSGYLTNTDWNTFNAKQGALTLTTTGTSGPSTLVGDTLNIPQYQSVLTNPITGLGTINYVPKFTSASSIGDSNIQDDGSLITLGSTTTVSSGSLGVGPYSLTGYGFRVSKDVTGSVNAVSIGTDGTIKSDVTTSAINYRSGLTTDAATFTLPTFYHFAANQGTIGAGSTITSQIAFFANANLNGATNNYGFYGNLQLASNTYNLYMPGTANNYLAGSLGIGTTNLTGINFRVGKFITGSVSSHGIFQDGMVQSDVTSDAYGFRNTINTQATSFTLTNYWHFTARQATIGAGSIVTSQQGFHADSTLIGATNNYGFRGSIPIGTNRWNIYMDGTANNYLAGALGIGTTSLTGYNLRVSKNITGATTAYGVMSDGVIQSDVTASARSYYSNPSTSAAAFTLTNLYHFIADQSTIGSGSSVTNQYGFLVGASVIGATNNYAYYGNIASGTGRWNIYMNGTADNYMAGSLGIGNSSLTGYHLRVQKNITGATSSYSVLTGGVIQSDVTSTAQYYTTTASTAAATFTLASLIHYRANSSTFGAGSTVTNQYGFWADTTITGATNNYGFAGSIPAATNSWNLYMVGTANNYLAGSLGIGTTSLTQYSLRVTKNITGATTSIGIHSDGIIQSDVTGAAYLMSTNAATVAATFTLNSLSHYRAFQTAFGTGSTVTNQYGFLVDASLTGATNNYGFYGNIASGTNRWNLYMAGTAANFLQGELQLGSGQVVSASVLSTVTNKIKLIINGTTYYLLASTSGT